MLAAGLCCVVWLKKSFVSSQLCGKLIYKKLLEK